MRAQNIASGSGQFIASCPRIILLKNYLEKIKALKYKYVFKSLFHIIHIGY